MKQLIEEYKSKNFKDLLNFIKHDSTHSFYELSKLAEYVNNNRQTHSAYYTDELILDSAINRLPSFEKENLVILEPSVGAGNFIPYIIKKYHDKQVRLDLMDIDENALIILKSLVEKIDIPDSFQINFVHGDFLSHNFSEHYDLVVGNPPFTKITKNNYTSTFKLGISRNLSSYFFEKALDISDYVALIMPKNLLNTPEYKGTRDLLNTRSIDTIIDFGEKGFKGVLIETIFVVVSNISKPDTTYIESIPQKSVINQSQNYYTDKKMPYWIIYRDIFFDSFYNELELGIFTVFRDRQITNRILKPNGTIRVLKSRNISNDGKSIIDIPNYDSYVSKDDVIGYSVYKYIDLEVYISPNMTYNSRIAIKPKGVLVNGSLAILTPKNGLKLTQKDQEFISSKKYRKFLKIARNYQTRTLNIDNNSVFFYGIRRKSK
jgi:DNA (cytosine-5)-methyltransferase 1